MGWTLTTPISTPHGGTLDELRMTLMRHDSRPPVERIICSWEYGNTIDGTWKPGEAVSEVTTSHVIEGDEYTALVAAATPDIQTSDPSDPVRYVQVGAVWVERVYYAVKRELYEHLNSESKIPDGTVT
jgi:hypothetical protein